MEDEDELVPRLDERGFLDLSNRAWVNLDPVIWTMSMTLIKLDISYNHIKEIPPQISELVILRELIACFNKIVYIPPEIGRLKRLKRLVLNGNRIKELPEEIGQLDLLDDLIVSENYLEEVPVTVSKMSNLKILKLANNRLKKIPFEIADILTLEEVDCANNPKLESLPIQWAGETESVLFTCRVHRNYNIQMMELMKANLDLSKHTQLMEQENLTMKEKVAELNAKIDDLYKNMPKKIIRKMEIAAQKAAAREIQADNEDKTKAGCVIS